MFDEDPTLWMFEVAIILGKVADQSGANALIEVEATDEDVADQVHELALQWGKEHAAELVGKRILEDGSIIDNPNAEWRINASTRQRIMDLVNQAEEDGLSNEALADLIKDDTAFSEYRSMMIARTELRMADVQGNLIGWKESGVVEYKQWLLSDDHEQLDSCDENSDLGPIAFDDDFIDGDPPIHPSCQCSLVGFSKDAVDEGSVDDAFAVMEEAEKLQKGIIDDLAHEAATSPRNDLPQPTPEQIHTGHYQKGHLTISGIDIAIENPAGSKRKPEWPPLKAHYGYIKRVEGNDGDEIDCFVRPDTAPDYEGNVYIINQVTEEGNFDEHKIMLGYPTELEALLGYMENYKPSWDGLESIKEMTIDEFKNWLYSGNHKELA